jgi:DNA invertase Pin-like site-specific DNA recombinase
MKLRGNISELTKAGLMRAKARGVKLGNPQLRAGTPEAARKAAAAHRAKDQAKAADVLPFIRQAQAAGATTLQSIADAMTARGIPTPGGRGGWHPSTVSRVLAAQP